MRWVGLVRNVMIGREGLHRDVLLRLAAEAGAQDVRSHLATGNLTFSTGRRQLQLVARRLEDAIAQVIGRAEPVITRSHEWMVEFVAGDPFGGWRPEQPGSRTSYRLEGDVARVEHAAAPGETRRLSGVRRRVALG